MLLLWLLILLPVFNTVVAAEDVCGIKKVYCSLLRC